MAAENSTSKSEISDELSGKNCSLCLENNETKEAEKFCVDCGSYLCEQCLKYHNKFTSLRAHKIVDSFVDTQKEMAHGAQQLLSECCAVHQGQIIDNYCKDHDVICCGVCVTTKHRSCVNVGSINEAAKGVYESKELRETKESLEKLISRIRSEKDKRNNNITDLDQEKIAILKEIDEFEDDIIKRVKELADASREEVRSKHSKLVTVVKTDVHELETVISVTVGSLKTLNSCDRNEAQTFINNKNSGQIVNDAETLVVDLPSKWPIRKLEYCFDYEPLHKVTGLKTFGHFIEDTDKPLNGLYLAERYKGIINVKLQPEDKCTISGICCLDNGTAAVTDFANSNLKILNRDYDVCDSIQLDGKPTSLCISGTQEVAVTLRSAKKVQFVLCGDTLSMVSSFYTENGCEGVCFDSECEQLCVSFSTEICIYEKNGTLLKTIETDKAGEQLFSSAKRCVMSTDGELIYITQANGLIALSRNGERKWTSNDRNLGEPWGICLGPGNRLLVGGSTKGNILEVGQHGNEVSELLGAEEGMTTLYTLTYDRRNSKIMTGGTSNEIFIYTLCRK